MKGGTVLSNIHRHTQHSLLVLLTRIPRSKYYYYSNIIRYISTVKYNASQPCPPSLPNSPTPPGRPRSSRPNKSSTWSTNTRLTTITPCLCESASLSRRTRQKETKAHAVCCDLLPPPCSLLKHAELTLQSVGTSSVFDRALGAKSVTIILATSSPVISTTRRN